jgi:D-beta-D-heptose 7-phosphate kinase / D-beta-D-heptose 1-phosphate adenosyltransferase
MQFDINSGKDLRHVAGLTDTLQVGLTSGCWDMLHYLHLVYLQRCRRRCGFLMVAVDSDDMIRAAKGPARPIIPEQQRLAMVAALDCVDAAFIIGAVEDLDAAAAQFNVGYLFKNEAFEKMPREGIFGLAKGATLVIVPDIQAPNSTSEIIDRIVETREGRS